MRLWCVNELKNGLQQCSVIPAEPNLGEGVCCGGWWGGGVGVCVRTSTSKQTHKHSRIFGQLQLRAEPNCRQHAHQGKHTHTNTFLRPPVFFCLFNFLSHWPYITFSFMFFNNLSYIWQKLILSFSLPLSSRSQLSPPHMLNHLKVKFWRFLYIFPHSDVSSRAPHFVGRSCCTAVNREDAMRRPPVLRLGEKIWPAAFMFRYKVLMDTSAHSCVCVWDAWS